MQSNSTQIRDKIYIDNVDSILNNSCVARHEDVVEAINTQLGSDLQQLKTLQDEQAKLRSSYLRFLDIEKHKRSLRERAETAACLLAGRAISHEEEEEMLDTLEETGIVVPQDWRNHVPTWKVIAEIVRQFPKMQVVEIVRILSLFNFQVSRQAVESALSTRADKFRITRKGREKFVSLK